MIAQWNCGGVTSVNKTPQKIVALKTKTDLQEIPYTFFYSFKHVVILLPSCVFCLYFTDN